MGAFYRALAVSVDFGQGTRNECSAEQVCFDKYRPQIYNSAEH